MTTANQRPALKDGTGHDVIVVGARPAGAATAMLLARRGLRVLLLDRGRPGADALSTHALMRGGVLQLSRWGLLEAVVAAGTPPVRRTTFRYGDEHVVISMKPSHGVDALYAPRRTVLDPLLVESALAAGVDVYHNTAVTDVIRQGERVVGVRATTCEGRSVDLTAALVVGADGVRSTVAELVGAEVLRAGGHASAATYGYWSGLGTEGYEWNFHPNACSGAIPTNDGHTCVFACASPERIGRGGTALLVDLVAEGAPELAKSLRQAEAPLGTRTWSGQRGYLRRAYGPGWALVGDAGYFKDPISAHGLTDALRDAELLARAVTDGLNGGTSLGDALESYQSTRDCISIPLLDVADRIASQQWDTAEIGHLLLRLSSVMTDEIETLSLLSADDVK